MRIFTGDWISWRKEHGPKDQLLTLLTIEKLSPSFGRRQHPTVPQRGENTGAKGKRGKIKSQQTASLDFCTFWTLPLKISWNSTFFPNPKKSKGCRLHRRGRDVFLCRNIPIKNFSETTRWGGVQSLLILLSIPFAVCFCLWLDNPWILALTPRSCVYKVPRGSCQPGGGKKKPTNSVQVLKSCQMQLE